MKNTHQQRWFINRIGKRVFRNDVYCKCKACKEGTLCGLIINNKQHAIYLFNIQNDLGVFYRDKI